MVPARECLDIPDTRDTSNTQVCPALARCRIQAWLTGTGCPIQVCQDPGAIHLEVRVCQGLVTSQCASLISRKWTSTGA